MSKLIRYGGNVWNVQLRPVSAISRMVCLIAQLTLSIKSLNCGGGKSRSAVEAYNQASTNVINNHRVHTGEAVEIDSTQKFIKANAMLREFGEILSDHIQRWFKNCVENCGYMGSQ